VSILGVRIRTRWFGAWALMALASIVLAVAAPARAAITFPPLTGRVVDDAHVLSPEQQADLTRRLGELEARTSRQLIVVTLPSLQGQDIEDYGYQLGRAWGVGQKGINNGSLFIVVPSEHKVRIEVGYGLEGVLTDAMTSLILQKSVLPRFRAGDIAGGVMDGTEAIVDQLGLDTSTAEQKAAEAASQQRQVRVYHRHSGNPWGAIIAIFVIFWVLRGVLGGRGGGGMGWFLPGMILGGLMGGGRRDDDDWGGGGGGGSGGGFGGGGGGSFGGGGSSGSW
jgi:uncharacterized protein